MTTTDATMQPLATTGAPRACAPTATVTATAYLPIATIPSATARRSAATAVTAWLAIGRTAMPKVDFHNRWPLLSTS